ncbi:hypothetical protein N7470_000313 [Penicillium chermesinum]|nr:hypothetical protein N7470_000313 [Penicillium chermesinum]
MTSPRTQRLSAPYKFAGTLWALEKKLDPIISEVQDIGKDVASGDYPVAELLTDIKGVVQGTSPNLVSRLRSKSQDSDLWDNDDGEKLPPADFAAESGKPRNGFLCRIFSATRTYLLVFFVIAVDLVLHFWITKTVTEYV